MKLNWLLTEIKQHDTIVIHRHTRPDGDCIGAQIGLQEIIKSTYPDKKVYAVGDMYPQLTYIGDMDVVDDEAYDGALVIIVDVANKERISDIRYTRGKKIIRIDHHPFEAQIGEQEWIDPTYSSCCEMITEFYLKYKDELNMSKKAATGLYYGIITDTNRFSNPNISERTLFLASKLLGYDLDLRGIYQNIYTEPFNIIQLRGHIFDHLTVTKHGLGYFYINQELCKKYGVDSSLSSTLSNSLSFIEGVSVWFIAIIEPDQKHIRVSLRSDYYPINHIAKQFGGGGHKNACGVILNSEAEITKLAQCLDQYLEEVKQSEI